MERRRQDAQAAGVVALVAAGLLVVCSPLPSEGQSALRGRTASPHGTLSVSCENCHSTSTWKPIRAVPEFDHDRQTRYPLRAMHKGGACRSCHVSPDLKNAAT